MTEQLDGQASLFDQDLWYGRTSQAPTAATSTTDSETSALCWKKYVGSQNRDFLFLDCVGSRNGQTPDAFVVTDGVSLGELTTLNIGESPNVAVESRLSQILVANAPEKYYLSAKACQGILNRAVRRGKKLPDVLREALENVIALESTATTKQ